MPKVRIYIMVTGYWILVRIYIYWILDTSLDIVRIQILAARY